MGLDLLPASGEIKVRARVRCANSEVEDGHSNQDGDGSKETLETNSAQGSNLVSRQELLLDHKLSGGEDLGKENEEDSENGLGSLDGLIRVGFRVTDEILGGGGDDRGESDGSDTSDDSEESEPFIGKELSAQENN